jgi:hypothetical protein
MGTMRKMPVDHAALRLLPNVDPEVVRASAVEYVADRSGVPADDLGALDIVAELTDEIVSTRDAEWCRQLVLEAVIGWPDETADVAMEMLRSQGWRRRVAAAELMNDLCNYRPERNLEFAQAIIEAIDSETDPNVLSFLVVALSCAAELEGFVAPEPVYDTDDPSYRPFWSPISPEDQGLMDRHEIWTLLADERLDRVVELIATAAVSSRRRLAIALRAFDPSNRRIRSALLGLTADAAEEVRDWATFAVIQAYPSLDGDDVRAALWARVADTDWEVRDEAIAALAIRKAGGAFELLERGLREEPSDYLLGAAADLADPALLPALMAITKDRDCTWFRQAVEACGGRTAETAAG